MLASTPSDPLPSSAAGTRRGTRRDLGAAAALILGAAVAGIPLGWWWQSASPRTRAYVDPDGFIIPEQSEAQIGADMRALLLFAVLGAALGIGAWLWRSRRGPVMAIGAPLAAAAGAASIALSGRWLGGGEAHGAARSVITLPVALTARPLLLLGPMLCAVIYLCGAIFSLDDGLRRDRGAADRDAGPDVFVLGAPGEGRETGPATAPGGFGG